MGLWIYRIVCIGSGTVFLVTSDQSLNAYLAWAFAMLFFGAMEIVLDQKGAPDA